MPQSLVSLEWDLLADMCQSSEKKKDFRTKLEFAGDVSGAAHTIKWR